MNRRAEVIWMPERPLSSCWYSADDRLGALHEVEHVGVDEAPDEEIGVAEAVEADQRPHPVVGVAGEGDHLARLSLLDGGLGQRLDLEGEDEPGMGQDAAGTVEDDGLGERAQGGLGVDDLAQALKVQAQAVALAVEIGRHRQGVGADVLLVLLEIGLGDVERVLEGAADAVAEPGLEARAQEEDGEHGDEDRGCDGNDAEERHEPGMQPRAGVALLPLQPEMDEPAGDDRAQEEKEDEVEVEQEEDGADVPAVGRRAARSRRRWQHRRRPPAR